EIHCAMMFFCVARITVIGARFFTASRKLHTLSREFLLCRADYKCWRAILHCVARIPDVGARFYTASRGFQMLARDFTLRRADYTHYRAYYHHKKALTAYVRLKLFSHFYSISEVVFACICWIK